MLQTKKRVTLEHSYRHHLHSSLTFIISCGVRHSCSSCTAAFTLDIIYIVHFEMVCNDLPGGRENFVNRGLEPRGEKVIRRELKTTALDTCTHILYVTCTIIKLLMLMLLILFVRRSTSSQNTYPRVGKYMTRYLAYGT